MANTENQPRYGATVTRADGVIDAGLRAHMIRVYNYMTGALGLTGVKLFIAVALNCVFAAISTLGIGFYAPCMILVSLLGMTPLLAFPIMMGSSAFLMPVGSLRFVNSRSYEARAAAGLALGGLPAVLIAAFIVKSLPLDTLRRLVMAIALWAAFLLFRSAYHERARSGCIQGKRT